MVSNALVAFLCLCYSPTTESPPGILRGTGGDDGVGVPDNTLVQKAEYHDVGFGVHLTGVEHYWVMPRSTPDQRNPQLFAVQIDAVEVGWPLTAFRSSAFTMDDVHTLSGYKSAMHDALSRPTTYSVGLVNRAGASHRLLPNMIAPLGFVANSLLYSALVLCLWTGLLRLRGVLRRRASCCTRCNYPLAALPRCPECGLDAPPHATASVATSARSDPVPNAPSRTPLSATSAPPSATSAFCLASSPRIGVPQ